MAEEARGCPAVGIIWIREPLSHEKALLLESLANTCLGKRYEVHLKAILTGELNVN